MTAAAMFNFSHDRQANWHWFVQEDAGIPEGCAVQVSPLDSDSNRDCLISFGAGEQIPSLSDIEVGRLGFCLAERLGCLHYASEIK